MDVSEITQLEQGIEKIAVIADRMGLDTFPMHFEVVPASMMHELGAYGLPGRYSHWSHGRSYQQSKTKYDYGLTKVYELIINSNPCYAFLLDTNPVLQNLVVAAHCFGHNHVFKNNEYFKFTDRGIVEAVATHAGRIREYEHEYGNRTVEEFIDAVLALEWNVDPHTHFKRRPYDEKQKRVVDTETAYDDLFYIGSAKRAEPLKVTTRFPLEPESDVLLFIAEYARGLEDWQRDIIHIVRNESLYFSPQARTKPLNEGFATFCHSRIIREMELPATDYVMFSRMHASILAHEPGRYNPYALGFAILEDIEKRWNDPSKEERERSSLRQTGQGMAKVMEVASTENDVSLVSNYFTAKLCEDQQLYTYQRDEDGLLVAVDRDWEKVREQIIHMLTNNGQPYIVIENGDYKSNSELLLRHQHEGHDLDIRYTEQTLKSLHTLWGRTVHLATRLKEKPVMYWCDGVQHRRDGDP